MLTRGEEAVKGSGRSIDEYHMFKKLTEVSDLLLKFGGHPLAAGLSLEEKNIDEFRRRLNENAGLTEEDFKAKVWDRCADAGGICDRTPCEGAFLSRTVWTGQRKTAVCREITSHPGESRTGRNRNVVKDVGRDRWTRDRGAIFR